LEIKRSFTEMINDLRRDFSEELESRQITSLQGFWNTIKSPFAQNKIGKEVAQICEEIVKKRIDVWTNNPPNRPGVKQTVQPILQQLYDELSAEVAKIENQLNEIRFQLTGWQPGIDSPGSTIGLLERILCTGAGLLLGDVVLAATGGAGGWKGMVGSISGAIAGSLAIGLIAGFLGVTLAFPVVLAGVVISAITGGVIGSRMGLEKKIKNKILPKVQEELSKASDSAAPIIDEEVSKAFDQLKSMITEQIHSVIRDDEQNIQKMLEDTHRQREEKQHLKASLEQAKQQISQELIVLNEMKVKLAQVG